MTSPADIAATWGRELCEALSPYDDELTSQDAYEFFSAALDRELTISALGELTEADIKALTDRIRLDLEDDTVDPKAILQAIKQTLWHWTN